MSQGHIPPQYTSPSAQPADPLEMLAGLAWVLSFMSIMTCGCLSPVSLILAIVALKAQRPENRGMAMFALIFSGVQVIWLVGLFLLSSSMTYVTGVEAAAQAQRERTKQAISEALELIEEDTRSRQGLPDEKSGTKSLSALRDGWDGQLRFELDNDKPGAYSVRSAGSDGDWDTPDDFVESAITAVPTTAAEALLCLEAADDSRRRAGLQWALRASPDTANQPQIVQASASMLEVASLHDEAVQVLVRWMTAQQYEELTTGRLGNTAIRPLRVVEVMIESGDGAGAIKYFNDPDAAIRQRVAAAAGRLSLRDDDIARRIIADLWDDERMSVAIERVATLRVEPANEELLHDGLFSVLQNKVADVRTQRTAMELLRGVALGNTREREFLRLAERDDAVGEWAIDTLLRRKQPQVLEQVAQRLADPEKARRASERLKDVGSAAEPYVWKLLSDESLFTRRRACEVLAVIGSESSIPRLQPLTKDDLVGEEARSAITAIQDRGSPGL